MALMMLLAVLPAVAENTELPLSLQFDMSLSDAAALLGEEAEVQCWDVEPDSMNEGMITLNDITFAGLDFTDLEVDFSIANSKRVSRLNQIMLDMKSGDNIIADFREAVAALTALYGEPDEDPFSEGAVDLYVEYGALSAEWTKEDTRISLNMNRRYVDTVSLFFSSRKNFDPEDLK